MYTLKITTELSWRANILDLVSPVANFELIQNSQYPEIFDLQHIKNPSFQLTNTEQISVFITWSEGRGFRFNLEQQGKQIMHLQTDKPFYLEAYLSDHKLYQFSIEVNTFN